MHTDYEAGGCRFSLDLRDDVFAPTTTTQKLAEHLEIPPDSEVLDLGCGSGPLAILAALKGARLVHAVDVMPEACKLAWRNATLNGLQEQIKVACGSLFEPVRDLKFDIIIDDVSGVADKVARLSPWFPDPVPTGGGDGTALVKRVIAEAGEHLKPGGCLYFPVLSLSRSAAIIEQAHTTFGDRVEQIGSYRFPFCQELLEGIDMLEELRQEGVIDFTQRGSRYLWTLDIWRAEQA